MFDPGRSRHKHLTSLDPFRGEEDIMFRNYDKSAFIFCSLSALGVACGDSSGGDGQGFTECGGVTCQPGQYCVDSRFDDCQPGCTSDVNCAENQSCQDPDFFNVGVCRQAAVVTDPTCGNGACESGEDTNSCPADCTSRPVRDATCDGYAQHAQECGLLASLAEGIRQSCQDLDADTQRALIACNASETCSELRSCSGVDCFADGQCPMATPDCVLPDEVVDPFVDVPFTCR